jgi:hypothetical protein
MDSHPSQNRLKMEKRDKSKSFLIRKTIFPSLNPFFFKPTLLLSINPGKRFKP